MPDLEKMRRFLQPRSLKRVFAVTLTLLLLAEIATPSLLAEYYRRRSRSYVFHERLPRSFERIHLDLPSAIDYIRQNEGRYDVNVLFLGDSVAYGAGAGERESIPAYLEKELAARLPGRKVRVWNLAVPGSEPGDLYCLLRRVEGLRPDLVVADFNMIFYGKASIEDPIAFDWLYLDEGLPEDAAKAVDRIYPRRGKERIGEFFARHWQLYGKREVINAVLFGSHPRKKLEELVRGCLSSIAPAVLRSATTDEAAGAEKPFEDAEARRRQRERVAFMYSPAPVDPATNEAYLFTKEILEHLNRSGQRALVFMTDQNVEILGDLITCAAYEHNVRVVDGLLRRGPVPYISFYGKIPSWMFADHVHLNAAGNRHVAGILAEQLAPMLGGGER